MDAIPRLLGFLAGRGCHGALMLGTTGEGPSFSPAERESIWRAALRVREQHPGFRLLAGTGTPSLTETIDLTRMAFELGFDGVVTLPPYYFRKAGRRRCVRVVQRGHQQGGPARTARCWAITFPAWRGSASRCDLLTRLKDAFPAQFEGIKDSSHDTEFADGARQTIRPRLDGVQRDRL